MTQPNTEAGVHEVAILADDPLRAVSAILAQALGQLAHQDRVHSGAWPGLGEPALPELRTDSGDLGRHWLEGSRNGMSLVAHAALHLHGRAGLGDLIDAHLERAQLLARLVRQHGEFELLLQPQTNIVLYRWLPPALRDATPATRAAAAAALNRFNERLQTLQYECGASHVARTTLATLPAYRDVPVVALRAVLVNPHTRESDLQAVLAEQALLGAQLGATASPADAPQPEEALRHAG